MNSYQPVEFDRSKIEKCCGCINMYSGFKCLAWLQAIFCPLALLEHIFTFYIFNYESEEDMINYTIMTK